MKYAIFNDKKVLIKDFESDSDAFELCINYCNCSEPIYILPLESDGSVTIDGTKGYNIIKECGWKLVWTGNNKMNFIQ
jgi:hypothetical protein